MAFGVDTEYVKTRPFTSGANTQRVERYHGTYKDRVKVMRTFKNVETLMQFNDGWLVYYDYFKPHQALNGETPAETVGVKYTIKNRVDLVRLPVSKEAEIKSHTELKPVMSKAKMSLDKAYKRRRKPRITPPVPPIAPKMRKLA